MLCSSTTAAINSNVIVARSVFDPTKDVLKQSLHCELPDLRVAKHKDVYFGHFWNGSIWILILSEGLTL